MTEVALLVLEDGTIFEGEALGATGESTGEAVFTTGMTGYQETLTDPSYHRQIVVQTAVHIGNTGMNEEDGESRKIWVAGYVTRERPRPASSWRAKRELIDDLVDEGIVGICEVDTRAITMKLRDAGVMRAGVFSGAALATPVTELIAKVRAVAPMAGSSLINEVTRQDVLSVSPKGVPRFRVAALDLGIKKGIIDQLVAHGIEVLVAPMSTTSAELAELGVDGVMLSNGPGDPATADEMVRRVEDLLKTQTPIFGVCFGNQLLGRALGLDTYKLPFGHRGLNLPVQNTQTGKVEITTHNHGFAVSAPSNGEFETKFGRARVSHRCLNDDVVEGLVCLDVPAFSVQYHPEANAGPHDAAYLFDDFVALLEAAK